MPVETSSEITVYIRVMQLDSNFACYLSTETQHTDCSHHCKYFKGKEWKVFLLLPRIKKAFLFTKKAMLAKEATTAEG